MWYLVLLSPNREPREYALPPGRTTMGRQPDNAIVLPDSSASRLHAEVNYDPEFDNALLLDLGSTNGTYVNTQRLIRPRPLQAGDRIRIGQHILLVDRENSQGAGGTTTLPFTRPITRELVLEGVEQHAVLMHDVGNRLNLVLDLPKALQEVAQIVRGSLGADKCEVVLAENFSQLAEMGLPTTIARQALDQQAVVAILDTAAAPGLALGRSGLLLKIRSCMCVPILIAQQVAGLLYLYKTSPSKRLFTTHDVELALAISHQAALAIQRAKLMDRVQKLEDWATIDSLTGLSNRRQFFVLGEREFHRAKRFNRPLTALMLDLDRFNQINEECGRAVGDILLQAVADRCRRHLRDVDLLARYGGDEFVVLLVETDRSASARVAERCRQAVGEGPVDTPGGPLRISLSLGAATRTDEHSDLLALLQAADAALFAAKQRGGNRVELAPE